MTSGDYRTSLRWGILHGVNDCVAGYMLSAYALSADQPKATLALIVYSILAFGGQLPVGLWLDAKRDMRLFSVVPVILLIAGCTLYFVSPFAAIVVAGFASAGIHVTGGCICLLLNKGKFGPLGVFTAPGVAGLAVGSFCGLLNSYWLILVIVTLFILFVPLVKGNFPAYAVAVKAKEDILDSHDMVMIVLLLLMRIRSFLFDLLNTFSGQFEYGLLVVGLGAFAGKIVGAFFADRIGWRRWVFITLPLSFVLLQLGHDNLLLLSFGIACLQSSVPITLQLMYNTLPHYPATASALSLGTIVAFAGLPLYLTPLAPNFFNNSFGLFAIMLVVALVLLAAGFLFYLRSQQRGAAIK